MGALDSVLGTTMATEVAGKGMVNSFAVLVVTDAAACGWAHLLYVSRAAALRT
jgi:hypothetical protein